MDKIEHITLFMADGPQKCTKEDHEPCRQCGGATFTLTSVSTGGTWNCYTHMYDHPKEVAPERCEKVVNLSEYRAKKADI